jgi:hypothetical protein
MERKVRKPSPWLAHVKEFAISHNTSYACALSTPLCREQYHHKKEMLKNPKQEMLKNPKQEIIKAPEEEDYDVVSSRLQQLIYVTPMPKLVKALVSLGFRGKLPAQAVLKVMTILQNFKTIPKMKGLISAIGSV